MENIFADDDLIDQLQLFSEDCSIGYVYSTSIRNKNVYQIEEDDGKFIIGVNNINKHYITLQCRNCVCLRKLLNCKIY